MANSIALAQKYVPILDEKYVAASKTSVLDSQEEARFIKEANTFLVADRVLAPMANYDRNNGYAQGDVTLNWTPYVISYDRGRMLVVDERDNEESAGMAFLNIAGQYIDECVVPELDAYRIAQYATKADASNKVAADITTSQAAYDAVRAAATALANANVPVSDRVLFVSETVKGLIEDLDSYKSRAALNVFGTIESFADGAFGTTCTLTPAGGFVIGGKNINFIAVHKKAVIQHLTHVAPKIITPEVNQDADAYKFGYRVVGIADVYKNKKKGIYVHTVA